MTRFGWWFVGAIVIVAALFTAGLMLPSPPRTAEADVPIIDAPPPPPVIELAPVDGKAVAAHVASGLVMPVPGVRPADLADTFGDPRGDGERSHIGLDIPAPKGTAVIAAADGIVEKLFDSDLGGHTVYVRSPNRRNIYYYAHLDTYTAGLREGQAVRAGERIGTVGATGDAATEAPHLHFEISRVDPDGSPHEGRPINPYPLLAGKPAGG